MFLGSSNKIFCERNVTEIPLIKAVNERHSIV